jgi:hypothetical protein
MGLVGNPNLVIEPNLVSPRAVAGMASFSGEGPFGATCAACVYVEAKSRRSARNGLTGKCVKYSALMRRVRGPAFSLAEQACKYFEPAPKGRGHELRRPDRARSNA